MTLNHTIEQIAAMTVRADSRALAEDCLALIRENERLQGILRHATSKELENMYRRRALGDSND